MAISLTNIINAIQAKASATDSSSSISDVLKLSLGAEKISDGTIIYDSSGVLPNDSDFIGGFAGIQNGTIFYRRSNTWNIIGKSITSPYSFQGSISGYSSGGFNNPLRLNIIEKFSFTSDGNATDVGDLLDLVDNGAGVASSTHGYTSGGYSVTPAPTFYDHKNLIEKYSFSSDGNSVDAGALRQINRYHHSASSDTHGYFTGGRERTAPTVYTNLNDIQKFSYSRSSNTTDVGDLNVLDNYNHAGCSSSSHGYTVGGIPNPSRGNVIEKFPFATDANASDVGDLTISTDSRSGQSSTTHGYRTSSTNTIEKFSFSTDGNATDVGDTIDANLNVGGNSSTTHGYGNDGLNIEKFPFSVDANSTDVGDLTVSGTGKSSNVQI